ncbi:MAG: Fe-S biogenesis protein NfuA, partial [Gammaproteobacteria bacterium]|nr:Fe-S biogenesis protein NfuA [Gammaproteobacteria bacterium]
MIDISQKAQEYLRELLAKQEDDDVGIRVFV